MQPTDLSRAIRCSIIIPCYNEENTLARCVDRVLGIRDDKLSLEVIIVDDASKDRSLSIARDLARQHPEVTVLEHSHNQGKGASLRTGFNHATGEFVAVQDADLEYNPSELRKLLAPLADNEADVVFGSRFLASGAHRVLYFWHYLGNAFLTFLSNMCTDLNLTDMETCYKVFRRDVVKQIEIEENRFGVEPEIVAKVAHMRLRIFEMGISYYGRTYEEGKKIGIRDGFRALYCILHYNAPKLPAPMQFMIYLAIGGLSALFNLASFMAFLSSGLGVAASALIAYFSAALVNYFLCIALLFRHKARWSSAAELFVYLALVCATGLVDLWTTQLLIAAGCSTWLAKSFASIVGLILNFLGRRYLVFPERPSGPWKPQVETEEVTE